MSNLCVFVSKVFIKGNRGIVAEPEPCTNQTQLQLFFYSITTRNLNAKKKKKIRKTKTQIECLIFPSTYQSTKPFAIDKQT